MRIVLIKDHAVALRVLPEGTELRVSNKLGAVLIALEVAKEFGDYTKEERVEHILEVAFDNEESPKVTFENEQKPKVKKITKTKK